ncbi:MAG: hypothetical protein WCO93_02525 [bacterium]
MKRFVNFSIFLFLFSGTSLLAQETKTKPFSIKGYLNDLQMVQFQKINDPWIFDNEVHNRLDISWVPSSWFSLGVGMRNRLIFGQSLTINPASRGMFTNDPGWINMTWDIYSASSFMIITQLDRAWISFTDDIVQLTIGRQRINWGQAIVWNPNDIFNTYSYFDIDYPERPGSDAVRLQVYPSSTSVIEVATKCNAEGKVTMAGMGRFNTGGYDIQFMTGLVDEQDFVFGAGWSGNISKAAFRGEISYYQPRKQFFDTTGTLLATIGSDYTFGNSLALTFQVMYNQLPPGYQPQNIASIYQAPASPKMLSFAEWNLFLMGSYPFTPLFDASLAVIYFPDRKGFFIGPTLNYNLRQNVDLSLFYQYFNGWFSNTTLNEEQQFFSSMLALRLKWTF